MSIFQSWTYVAMNIFDLTVMSLLFLRMVSYIFIYNLNAANLTGSELMNLMSCDNWLSRIKSSSQNYPSMNVLIKHDNLLKVSYLPNEMS